MKTPIQEKSTASSLGIPDIQLKALHGEVGLAHNAELTPVKTKSELKNAITSETGEINFVIGLTGEGDLFVARKFWSDGTLFNVSKIVDGKVVQYWKGLSVTKAIAKFVGVKKYFTAHSKNLYARKGYSNTGPLDKEDELDSIRDKVKEFTIKLIEKEFEVVKEELKDKISEYIKDEKFKSARALMERLYLPSQYSFSEDMPLSMANIINGRYTWSKSRSFESEIWGFLQKRKSPGSIRKRAAQLARKYADEVRQKLLRDPE